MALAPSSPRLPSPPPPAEIQIGPKSPSGGDGVSAQTSHLEQTLLDANAKRRIHPGTKAADMAAGPPLVLLHELDSPFQLQEHLAALHYHHTASGTQPLTRDTALQLSQPPPGIDRTLWLYELCRFLISQCNSLIVGFLFDTPPCSASTCPEMRASEWQFLCSVHDQPKSCCAIDYCCHTLDWAANVVTDQKIFPSRFVVQHDNHSKNIGVKNLVNVFRRLHRIFAHAWFQHRSVFWAVEGQTGLYVFFKTVCDLYDLLSAENYKLPPEAEGLEAPPDESEAEKPTPTILKQNTHERENAEEGDNDNLHPIGRTNTRRHIRSSPSTGSAVTTVIETDEEDADGVARKMKQMHISAHEMADEEPEVADVPVIVEQSVIAEASPEDKSSSSHAGDEPDAGEVSDADQTVVEASSNEETTDNGPTDLADTTPSSEPPPVSILSSSEHVDGEAPASSTVAPDPTATSPKASSDSTQDSSNEATPDTSETASVEEGPASETAPVESEADASKT